MKRKSISKIVEEVLKNHPSVLDCLNLGVINYTALARSFLSEVEKTLGGKATLESVKISLIRLSKSNSVKNVSYELKIKKVLAHSVLRIESDVVVLDVDKYAVVSRINELLSKVLNARFFQLTQSTKTWTLVVSREHIDVVKEVIGKHSIINKVEDQSAIILISPKDIIVTPGVIAYITTLLFREGINITQLISCYTDTIFILDKETALKAYKVLDSVIQSFRNAERF